MYGMDMNNNNVLFGGLNSRMYYHIYKELAVTTADDFPKYELSTL